MRLLSCLLLLLVWLGQFWPDTAWPASGAQGEARSLMVMAPGPEVLPRSAPRMLEFGDAPEGVARDGASLSVQTGHGGWPGTPKPPRKDSRNEAHRARAPPVHT